jgi:hypothetical protein
MGLFKRSTDDSTTKGRPRRGRMGLGLSEHRPSAVHTDDQGAPEPERVTRPDEEAGTAVHELKEPPQAEA